jgi:hypothetical protein
MLRHAFRIAAGLVVLSYMRNCLLAFLVLSGAAASSAAPLNDLYFGLDNMRGFAEVYWWFQADGRVLRNQLPTGITPAIFDAACQQNPANCGDYTLSGEKLSIKYKNGQTENWTYKVLNGGIQLNYLILTPVKKYPAGTHLNGTWSRAFSSTAHSGPGSNVTVTAPSFYTFKPDGTFLLKSIAGVDTESNVKGASGSSSQTSDSSGTYAIRDFTLTLTKNGKSEQHVVFPAPGDNLNIDGTVYKKQP